MKRAGLSLLSCLALVACAHAPDSHGPTADATGHDHRHEGHDRTHRFDDPERWAEEFEAGARDAWQKPEVVIEALALGADDVVADIGSATGYFPVRIAPRVPDGRVWGVDIEPGMVRHLNERARREGLANLFSILGTPQDPLLPEPVSRVLLVNTYHHITDRTSYFERVAGDLAPGGRLVVVDFEKGDLPVGPPDSMKIPPEQVQRELEAAGYVLERAIRGALPYQFILVFRARAS